MIARQQAKIYAPTKQYLYPLQKRKSPPRHYQPILKFKGGQRNILGADPWRMLFQIHPNGLLGRELLVILASSFEIPFAQNFPDCPIFKAVPNKRSHGPDSFLMRLFHRIAVLILTLECYGRSTARAVDVQALNLKRLRFQITSPLEDFFWSAGAIGIYSLPPATMHVAS